MSAKLAIVLPLVAGILSLAGCTYLEARSDLSAGGPQQRVAAAQGNVTAAQNANQNLQDQQLALSRDIDRNEQRIAAAQTDLDRTNAALESARAGKRLSEGRYAELKKASDALNLELARLDLELQSERGKPGAAADVAAKEARLQELVRRKDDLERAIKLALGT